ncbi:hypothetical protein Tco_1109989 [Tanacetum coccineum]|uniref:Uncharacterized protein n=1 Tax=Tanacetum coccineum TaxID=301880 RepID=A0ABQ5IHI0_9ASTR
MIIIIKNENPQLMRKLSFSSQITQIEVINEVYSSDDYTLCLQLCLISVYQELKEHKNDFLELCGECKKDNEKKSSLENAGLEPYGHLGWKGDGNRNNWTLPWTDI